MDYVNLTIRIPPDWLARLNEIAEERSTLARRVSISEVVREALAAYIEQEST